MTLRSFSIIVPDHGLQLAMHPSRVISPEIIRAIADAVLITGNVQIMISLGPPDGNYDREFRVTIDDQPNGLSNWGRVETFEDYRGRRVGEPAAEIDYGGRGRVDVAPTSLFGFPITSDNLDYLTKKPDPIIPRPKDIIRRRG